ncbi:MAG: hypothetical protein LBL86_01980 [Coriobacteriales bacterium]|jgi:electron transfer flavoprotein beta subunit|nr:hypothetical protein [Coriobacteriales bacterium]
MSDVIVAYKWVLDESDVKVRDDLSVDFGSARGKISEYDRNAIEAGRRMAEALQGRALGVSCGPAPVRKSFSDALSRGLDEGIWVDTGEVEASAQIAARALAAVARQTGAVAVVCAEGSSDDYARQTPSRIGALLDWPTVTAVNNIEVKEGTLLVRRRMDECVQVVEVPLPAVLSVLPETCLAPIPSLKEALAAKRRPVDEKDAAGLGVSLESTLERVGVRGYLSERRCNLIEGETAAELAAGLLAALKKEGVL